MAKLVNFQNGTRWSETDKAMVWSQETELEDRNNNVSKEANSMEQFAKMASQMLGCLNFTYDVPQNNPNNRMPVLDTEIWIGQEQREIGIPPEILESNQISKNLVNCKTSSFILSSRNLWPTRCQTGPTVQLP